MTERFNINFEDIKKVKTWHDWDKHYTSKIYSHKYPNLADYYHASSSMHKIQGIKKPTLVIHSKDDPIIPIECLPMDECLANPKIIVGVVEKGGHVCYFEGFSGQ